MLDKGFDRDGGCDGVSDSYRLHREPRMSKELWLATMEKRMAELIDAGVPESMAYDLAANQAHDIMRENLADHADNLRKRAKEQS
jgi:hypothetical protein